MSDTKTATLGTGENSLTPNVMHKNTGNLGGKKVAQWKKPLFIALIIIGGLGLVGAGVGLASFGAHQGWWTAGSLSNLDQVYAIIMMGVGGGGIIFLIAGIVGLVTALSAENEVKCLNTKENNAEQVATIEHPLVPLELQGSSTTIDASYDRDDDSGILDLAYHDTKSGFGCVVDGTGHNNPRMRTALKEHFDPFIKKYSEGLSNDGPTTQEKATQYFKDRFIDLNKQFKDKDLTTNKVKVYPLKKQCTDIDNDPQLGTFLDSTYRPAMSFAQLVRVQDQLILLTAQAGDTMIVVEMLNGELRTTQKSSHQGVGDKVPVQSFDITGAKRVIGFSDGIGEFMTFEELKEIITTTASDQLFNRLKEKAISDRAVDSSALAANGAYFKAYEKDNQDRVDDMSLFVLDI